MKGSHRSIGEVLETLKPDFPDVSISKIRFLESEGLIRPERTASGYRKFSQRDLDRLRFVLTLQRDSYLPLRVIRQRLADADATGVLDPTAVAPASRAEPEPLAPAPEPPPPREEDPFAPSPSLHLTDGDLADQTGLELGRVRELAEFGVICLHSSNGGAFFDEHDLAVARIAQDFLKLGMEARHLRMLRRSAEQEAGLFQQLVAPSLRNKRQEARQQATETLAELARLARALRLAYVRQELRRAVEP